MLVVKIGEAQKYGKRLATRVGAALLKREQDLQAGVPRSVGLSRSGSHGMRPANLS